MNSLRKLDYWDAYKSSAITEVITLAQVDSELMIGRFTHPKFGTIWTGNIMTAESWKLLATIPEGTQVIGVFDSQWLELAEIKLIQAK